jgi:hypothetical protein
MKTLNVVFTSTWSGSKKGNDAVTSDATLDLTTGFLEIDELDSDTLDEHYIMIQKEKINVFKEDDIWKISRDDLMEVIYLIK